MSKSRGNVVTPDEVVERYGADILRIYLLFMAPFDRSVIWDEEGIAGAERFLQRVWRVCQWTEKEGKNGESREQTEQALQRVAHKMIRRVTEDMEAFKFNTAIAALMEFVNALCAHQEQHGPSPVFRETVGTLLRLLAPFAPHIAEELWTRRGGEFSVHQQSWPIYDPALTTDEMVTLVVQVHGKVRDRIAVPTGIPDGEAQARAVASEQVQRILNGRQPKKVIVVPGRLVNVVV